MSRNLASAAVTAPDQDVAILEDVEIASPNSMARGSKVTFSVGPKSLLFLVGEAGSGKSRLLDLMSFQALAPNGRLEIFGINPAHVAPLERPRMRRRVGLVFQEARFLPDLDIFRNVAIAARLTRRRARDYAPEIRELLSWVGLGGRGSDPIFRLTDGEKQRLSLARALINRPELVLADNPTAGLGDKAERGFMRLIKEVNAAGTPVVLATRERSLAASIGGSIYEMPAREFG